MSGPPRLKIDLRAHSKPQFRQAVATQYYNEFLRIYKPLADIGSNLASSHAVDQEKAVHSKTNQGSYRSLAASVLQRLKKRPLAISEEDVGIDGEWLDPQLRAKEELALDDVWRDASKYVQTLEELEANGYPIEIPKGSPPPLEETQVCDRCQKQFDRKETLEEEDKLACRFHEMRIRSRSKDGKKYAKVIDIPGAGNSKAYKEYAETDYQPFDGTSYYHIKQTDFNGKIKYFPTSGVIFNGKKETKPYPSQADIRMMETAEITTVKNEAVLVLLQDAEGKDFAAKVVITKEGDEIFAEDTSKETPPGIYTVLSSSDSSIYSHKIIVKTL